MTSWPPDLDSPSSPTPDRPPRIPRQRRPPASNNPTSGTVVAWITGAAVAGAVTGAVLVPLTRPSTEDTKLQAYPAASGSSALTNPPVTIGPGPTTTPTDAEPTPDPATFHSRPWTVQGLELSTLKDIALTSDGHVRLSVDRLTVYSGTAAQKYFAAHPSVSPSTLAVVNQSPRVYTFTLATGTPIFASTLVGRSGSATQTTTSDFVDGVRAALAAKRTVRLWLRHDDADGGWVTYVAESAETVPITAK